MSNIGIRITAAILSVVGMAIIGVLTVILIRGGAFDRDSLKDVTEIESTDIEVEAPVAVIVMKPDVYATSAVIYLKIFSGTGLDVYPYYVRLHTANNEFMYFPWSQVYQVIDRRYVKE